MWFDIPDGQYPAVAGGYVSEFKVNGQTMTITCKKGVRGFGIGDIVTVDSTTQTISSHVLGLAESLKRVEEKIYKMPEPVLPLIVIPLINRYGLYAGVEKELRVEPKTGKVSLWSVETEYHIRDLDEFESSFVVSTIKAMKEMK